MVRHYALLYGFHTFLNMLENLLEGVKNSLQNWERSLIMAWGGRQIKEWGNQTFWDIRMGGNRFFLGRLMGELIFFDH